MENPDPQPANPLVEILVALAASSGTTPAGLIAELLKPFEQQIANRICDTIEARFKNTAEVSKPNEALQDLWNNTRDSD